MKKLFLIVVLVFASTISLAPQQRRVTRGSAPPVQSSQDGIDAVQNERISHVSNLAYANQERVEILTEAVAELTIKIDTYTNVMWIMGLIFGSIISLLQIMQLVQGRHGGKKNP